MNRRPRVVWIARGAVLVAMCACVVAIFQRGAARRSRALEVVSGRGEPLHARDIAFDGPDCSEDEHAALTRLSAALQSTPDADSVLDLDLDEIDAVRAWEAARASLPQVEQFVALGPESSSSKASDEWNYSQRIWWRVGDPLRTQPLSERDRLAVEIVRALNEPHWPAAQAVCLASPETGEREIRALAPGDFMPDIPIAAWLSALQVPLRTIPALVLEGNGDEAVRRWMTACRGVQRIRGLPYVLGYFTWSLANVRVLQTLWTILPALPRSFELSEVEQVLRAIDADSNTLRALVGERALGNGVFDSRREAGHGAPGEQRGGLSHWLTIPWVADDHAFYLEVMTDGIRRAELPYQVALAQRPDWQLDRTLYPRTATTSAMILPKIEDVLQSRAHLEATVRVATVALIARRAGSEAGLRAAASNRDPFDGNPLRARVESGGLFVVWSIGSDLVDDGAPPGKATGGAMEQHDIVWRVRLP